MISRRLGYRDSQWVADELSMEVADVERLMKRGELPGIQIGGLWRVSEAKLIQFLAEREEDQDNREPSASPGGLATAVREVSRRRKRDKVVYQLAGQPPVESSSKGMLVDVLQSLASRDSNFLVRFSREGGRKRRYVARAPADLYPGRPDLVEKYKASLGNGWWAGTNYNAKEIESIIRTACDVANLRWGKDLIVNTEEEAERIKRAMSFVGIASDPDPDASLRHDEYFAESIVVHKDHLE